MGYVPLGVAFGFVAAQAGHPWWYAVVMSTFVYSGATQFFILGLSTAAMPMVTAIVIACLLNLRHSFYGLSLLTRFAGTRWAKPYLIFAVTDETAKDGSRSLKITDAAGLGKSFYPYATYSTGDLAKGQVTIAFDIKQKADQPGKFGIDVRDYANKGTSEFASGVSFEIMGDGKLMVKGKVVAALPVGEWSHIEMSFGLGKDAPKEYTLSVTMPGKEAQTVKLPFANPNFAAMSSLYMIADDDKDAVTYLDNLTLTVK